MARAGLTAREGHGTGGPGDAGAYARDRAAREQQRRRRREEVTGHHQQDGLVWIADQRCRRP